MKTEGKHILPDEEIPADALRMIEILNDGVAVKGGGSLLKNANIGIFLAKCGCNQACFFRECRRNL